MRSRAPWLQDRRKFRDVLSRWEAGARSIMEAGELLGTSERQLRRYRERFVEEGEGGRGKVLGLQPSVTVWLVIQPIGASTRAQ